MLARAQAQLHEIRLDLHGRWLRHRERSALRGLGEEVARTGAGGHEALRHRRSLKRRALRPRFEALGGLAMGSADSGARTGARSRLEQDVTAVRDQLAATSANRDRWVAPFGGHALPAWAARAGTEAAGFGRAVAVQLRCHLVPKAPALAGLAVGWWIANTYTDSHLRSVLRSVGIGSGGTRVVSSSTYEAMSFWLPLLAAALCAYLGERIGAFYGGAGDGGESACER